MNGQSAMEREMDAPIFTCLDAVLLLKPILIHAVVQKYAKLVGMVREDDVAVFFGQLLALGPDGERCARKIGVERLLHVVVVEEDGESERLRGFSEKVVLGQRDFVPRVLIDLTFLHVEDVVLH